MACHNLADLVGILLIIPPPDDPSLAKPSDHAVAVAAPRSAKFEYKANEYRLKTTRPLPDSQIRTFGQWIIQEGWEVLEQSNCPSEQANAMQTMLESKLDEVFPKQSVKISNKDKKWIDSNLKKLDRQKKREWQKNGKSLKYLELKSRFDSKYKEAASKYLDKNIRELMASQPGKAYSTLKQMGAQPGDDLDQSSFTLIEHLEKNLTKKESVEKIAEHFSQISQEFPPLDVHNLSESVRKKLADSKSSKLPFISCYQVQKMLQKVKKSKSGIPGDLPGALIKEFGQELSRPLSTIYNNIISTGNWPKNWKIEYGLPLKKIPQPYNEDDIRVISLTSVYSKTFEKFVISWLLEYLEEKIDVAQYGGRKGCSISHYLIDFVNFVSYNQDISHIQAVLAVAVDFSKAFNRQNHLILIELLSKLEVPGWLLKIVIGFLENREMEVSLGGEKSGRKILPGGGPQGTILGLFLFLILINSAGFKDNIGNTGQIICNPAVNKRQPIRHIHLKWIDDMTIAESISLKDKMQVNSTICNPPRFHERTGHFIPSDNLETQKMLNELTEYTKEHEMIINKRKTKAILFNRARNYDFMPHLTIDGSEPLDVVEEIKLLGVVISSDLKWRSNTTSMVKKAFTRLWILRRLKALGASSDELLDVYEKQVRCIVEYASPVWTGGLTQDETNQIERVQKAAFAIILGSSYNCYMEALATLGSESLETRRKAINLKFAKKSLKNDRFAHWFCNKPTNVHTMRTRNSKVEKILPVQARTVSFQKSPLAYLTQLLVNE